MKRILALLAALAAAAALAQPAKQAAEAAPKPAEQAATPAAQDTKPAPGRSARKVTSRRYQDARHCLDKPNNTEIIKCAEAYL